MKRTAFTMSFPLLALCVGAAYGKGAEIVAGIGCLLALAGMVRDGVAPRHRATAWVISVFTGYFVFFAVHDGFFTGDPWASVLEMRTNLPILLSSILCLYAAREAAWLDAVAIGRAATLATLSICAVSIPLYFYVVSHPGLPDILSDVVADGRFRFHARNALMFASQLTGLSFLSLLGHGRRSRFDRNMAELACVLGALVVMFLAQARGATMTGLIMALAAIWYIRPSLEWLRTKIALLFVAAASALLALESGLVKGQAAMDRFGSMVDMFSDAGVADGSTNQRLIMYRAGWQAFLDHPLTGYGYSRRFEAAEAYFPPGMNLHYMHLHNDYITHMVAAGIPGLLVFLAYLTLPLAILFIARRRSRDIRYMGMIGTILMAGIAATTAILGHDVHSTYFSMFVVVTLTVAIREDGREEDRALPVS